MAEIRNFKVCYINISSDGLDKQDNVLLSSIPVHEKQYIKTLIFLPVNSLDMIDVTDCLNDLPLLENLYLPSMMEANIKQIIKKCPMFKSLILVSEGIATEKLDKRAVKVSAHDENGENSTQFSAFIDATSEDKQITYYINSNQVTNHELISAVNTRRVSLEDIKDCVSGDHGILAIIEQINDSIEDQNSKIEFSENTLVSLFEIFVEKGVSFEDFTIDFSKMCGKIESYKTMAKSVNQQSIKEDVEKCIIETYQTIIQKHYRKSLINTAKIMTKLTNSITTETENMLIADFNRLIANVVVLHPDFDENYKVGSFLDSVLDSLPNELSRCLKISNERTNMRKYVSQAVLILKENKESLIERIQNRLQELATLDEAREMISEAFSLDLSKKQPTKLINKIIDVITTKNFGSVTDDDISGMIETIKTEMGNNEIRSKEMLEITNRVVANYPTKEEISNVLIDFISENGYSSIKLANS